MASEGRRLKETKALYVPDERSGYSRQEYSQHREFWMGQNYRREYKELWPDLSQGAKPSLLSSFLPEELEDGTHFIIVFGEGN